MAAGSPTSPSHSPSPPPSPRFSIRLRSSLPRLQLDAIDEIPEYDSVNLNLGTESPGSMLVAAADGLEAGDEWAKAGLAAHASVHTRPRSWRSSSFSRKRGRNLKKEAVDRDCGICFEVAVMPFQTSCCGHLFCLEHITDWLHGPSSDGRCPSCESPCSLESDTPSFASPTNTRVSPHQRPQSSIRRTINRSATPSFPRPAQSPSPLRLCHTYPSFSPAHPTSGISHTDEDALPKPEHLPAQDRTHLLTNTFEIISRLISIVGLTLFLYVLLT